MTDHNANTQSEYVRLMLKYDHDIETVEGKNHIFPVIHFFRKPRKSNLPLFSLTCLFNLDEIIKEVDRQRRNEDTEFMSVFKKLVKRVRE